jgi:hypothetical protein
MTPESAETSDADSVRSALRVGEAHPASAAPLTSSWFTASELSQAHSAAVLDDDKAIRLMLYGEAGTAAAAIFSLVRTVALAKAVIALGTRANMARR